MARPHRSPAAALAAAIVLPLALAACGGEDSPAPSSSSATASSSTTSASSDGATTDDTGNDRTDSGSDTTPGAAGSPTGNAPDPDVTVTPTADDEQSTTARDAGIEAADAKASGTRLSIPAVGLSTSIGPQGLRGGKVNPAPGEVIWFTGYDRVRPGATGTSVIAGHVINRQGPDEFAALEQLEKGDGVVIGYPGGTKLRFEVTSTDIVDKDELTRSEEVWGDNTDSRRIVLVTCDDELGFREDGHRSANFVAVAELPS